MLVISAVERQRKTSFWGSLASHISILGELQFNDFIKKKWIVPEEFSRLLSGLNTLMCNAYIYEYLHTQEHVHKHTHIRNNNKY